MVPTQFFVRVLGLGARARVRACTRVHARTTMYVCVYVCDVCVRVLRMGARTRVCACARDDLTFLTYHNNKTKVS